MRQLLLLLLFFLSAALPAQDRGNPFEISSRLPKERTAETEEVRQTYSPFDIRPVAGEGIARATNSPALTPTETTAATVKNRGPIVIQPTDPNKGKGSILAIHLFLVLVMASLWLLFGDLLRQCLRSTVNDGVMNQLYTRRSGNQLRALWICYVFFYLVAGFYIYLFAISHDISLNLGIFPSWLTYALLVSAAAGLKHWVLWAYARLFPVRKEVSRYAFVLMVFSILAGVFLVPINLLASYAPESWRYFFLYAGIAIFIGVYALHLLRAAVGAGRLALGRPVHFLLYICAIEVAPLLLIYRYLSDILA